MVFLAPRQFISGFPPKAKQDYNQLFGYKYNSDHTIKSGVSPEGGLQIEKFNNIAFYYCS